MVSDDLAEGQERRVGRVVAVSAAQATVLLSRQDIAPLEMGNLVKMPTRLGTAYAMVSRLEVAEPALEPSHGDLQMAEIEFAGEIGEGDERPLPAGFVSLPRCWMILFGWLPLPICRRSMLAQRSQVRPSAQSIKMPPFPPTF